MGGCKAGVGTFMRWHVRVTVPALKQLAAIKDTRIKESISRRINALEYDPDKQGKPMTDDLAGYRSIRAVGQRYRILYRVEAEQVIVVVVALGIRKEGSKTDVYALAKKLARLGLLDKE
jgi:mRNA interferase RelE/StbE